MELISVIIPAYNAEPFLREAVESVLAQTYRPLEILIVAVTSSDNTRHLAESFGPPVKVIYEEKLGDAVARNVGIKHASGNLLAFLDADDYWSPNKLALQLSALQADPELEAVFGLTQEFTHSNGPSSPQILGDKLPAQLASALLIRKQAMLRVGLYEERYVLAAVASWYLRARENNLREIILPEVLTYRRIHSDNLGYRHRARQFEYVHALKAYLDCKRGKTKR